MPFMARCLGSDRPWRRGASLREVEAGDRLLALLHEDEAAFSDLQAWLRGFARDFPEARLSVAARDEAGGSTLFEVADGRCSEHVLELFRTDNGQAVDADGELALPEIALAPSLGLAADALEAELGAVVEAVDERVVCVPVAQDDAAHCQRALGMLAQLADAPCQALVAVDAAQLLAELDPELGCRLVPLGLRHQDPAVVERFSALISASASDAPTAWLKPPIPDAWLEARPSSPADPRRPLSTGTRAERLAALRTLPTAPGDWVADAMAGAVDPGSDAELRKQLYRRLAEVDAPEVAEFLWARLRDEDDEVARTLSHRLWQQENLLARIPRAVLEHWTGDRPFAVRLVLAAIDAHLRWPEALVAETPAELKPWLEREGLWPSGD